MRPWIWTRRSFGAAAAPGFAALIVVNVAARGTVWKHEWLWAFYQYHFVTVLLGPIAAGAAAWAGRQWSVTAPMVALGRRGVLGPAAPWISFYGWVVACYLAGLAGVCLVVVAAGTPGAPDLAAWRTLAPPLGLLAVVTLAGYVTGYLTRRRMAAPVVAVATFGVLLLLYVAGPGNYVTVGGASSSLVGITPKPRLELAQCVLYAALCCGLAMAVAAAGRRLRVPGRVLVAEVVVAVVAAVAVAGITAQGGNVFRDEDTPVTCAGSAPQVCVASGYTADLPRLRATLAPVVGVLAAAGATPPATFNQRADGTHAGVAQLDVIALLAHPGALAQSVVLSGYLDPSCDLVSRQGNVDAFTQLDAYLTFRLTGTAPDDLPARIRTAPPGERDAWGRRLTTTLRQCHS